MTSIDDIITELFKRGQLVRDSWWRAYVANLERIRDELTANEKFLADYAHLVQSPLSGGDHPLPPHGMGSVTGHDGHGHGVPHDPHWHRDDRPMDPDRLEAVRRWNEAVGRSG